MKRIRRFLMVIGILSSAFAGGAVSQWVLTSASRAEAAPKSRTKQAEEALRWSLAKPIITRRLTVGEPKTKASGIMDGSGIKLYDSGGKARISLGSASGTLTLADSSGKDRVKFGTVRGGQTGMALLDSSGRPRIQLDPKGLKIFNS
ncbi:MAG: hypothetical protein GY794_14340, partial [bacterium]|nr:hypothetical protein [bacterium]